MKKGELAVVGRPRNESRSTRPGVSSALAALAAAVLAATTLQGCDVPHVEGYLIAGNIEVSTHRVAEWRTKPNYWDQNAYTDPKSGAVMFNSCMDQELSLWEVCSGHGRCAPFDPHELEHPVFFCKCDPEWGGVECATRRKRQSVAWFLSLLFGPLALDELYLGMTEQTMTKLLWTTLGCTIGVLHFGVGASMVFSGWLFDVVRIGTGPVLTSQYRVHEDLSRVFFAAGTVAYFTAVGFFFALSTMYWTVLARRRHWDMMQSYSSTK